MGILSKLNLYKEIEQERDRQDEQWGGANHDDQHKPGDWLGFIRHQLSSVRFNPFAKADYRSRMIKVAALAVAAIETLDRKYTISEVSVDLDALIEELNQWRNGERRFQDPK